MLYYPLCVKCDVLFTLYCYTAAVLPQLASHLLYELAILVQITMCCLCSTILQSAMVCYLCHSNTECIDKFFCKKYYNLLFDSSVFHAGHLRPIHWQVIPH